MSPASPKPVVVYVATTARKLLRLFRERIIEMKRQGFEVIVCSGVDASVYALEGLGAEHIALPVTEQPDPGRLAAAFVLLTSALIERNALMVHSHSLSLHLAAATAARIAGTPIAVATVHHHGDLTNPVSQLLGRGYFQLVGQAVDAYIVHHTREHETAAAYAPADKLHFIEAAVGVDMRRFVPASDEEVASARRRLGLDPARTYVATLYRRGWPPASLLDLIDRVHSTAPDLGWIVAGPDAAPAALEGPLRERVEAGRPIELLPARIDRELPSIYGAADLIALPKSHYGAGLSAMEAAACARPVVAFEATDTVDVVVDGQTGALVGSTSAFIDAVVAYGQSARQRRVAGVAARARAERRFDFEHGQLALFSLYDRLIREKVEVG